MARRATLSTAYRSRYQTACLCHGLAGSLDTLLTQAEFTQDLDLASHIAHHWQLLDDFRVRQPSGISWRDHHLEPDNPSLMTGYGGVMLTLLRLATPGCPGFFTGDGIWWSSRLPPTRIHSGGSDGNG